MRRWSLAASSVLEAIVLASSGCSRRSPTAPEATAPEPAPPDVPHGTMIATVNGQPWKSRFVASGHPFFGPNPDALIVAGFADSTSLARTSVTAIDFDLPSSHPPAGTYGLADPPLLGTCEFLTAEGNYGYSTDRLHTGAVRVTRADSTDIEGGFHFDAIFDNPTQVIHVTGGAFNVPIESRAITP